MDTTIYRTEIRDLTSDQVTSLAAAVTKMKKLPSSDPSSFKYLASIHGAWYPESFPDHQSQEFCQHDSHSFAFWHRKYLKEVEIALQKNGWEGGLPYWDIERDTPGVIPGFFNKAPFDSSRYEASLTFNSGEQLRGDGQRTQRATTHSKTTWRNIVAGYHACADPKKVPLPNRFLQRTGYLESPHNSVHGYVGGDMSDPSFAAFDPIFFFHHCNVDRNLQLWLDNLSEASRNAVFQQAVPEIQNLPPWNNFTVEIARNDGIRYGVAPDNGDQPTGSAAPAAAPASKTHAGPTAEKAALPQTRPIRITLENVKKSIHVQSQGPDGHEVAESWLFVNGLAKYCKNCQHRRIAKGEACTVHHIPHDLPLEKVKVVVLNDPTVKVKKVVEYKHDKPKPKK